MMRGSILVGALFLGALMAGCTTQSHGADGDILVLGDPKVSGLGDYPGPFQSEIAAYDFDGDGQKEIVAQSTDRKVYVFDTDSGEALATLKTRYPAGWYIDQVSNGVKVAVLTPGGNPSIVVANHAAFVSVWEFDPGKSDDDSFHFTKAWEQRAACEKNPSMDGGPALADLTGDGTLEILVQNEETGLLAYEHDGTLLWQQCWGGGNGSPVASDLNGDGTIEAIFASDGGFVSVLNGKDGSPIWTFDASQPKFGIKPASISVAPAVGDLDGDGIKEIVFTARHAPHDDPERFTEFSMGIYAVHQDPATYRAELVWLRQPEWANPMSYTQLVLRDVDGDGKQEVFGMDWNTIGHRPGDWQRLGPGNAFRLNAEGEDVWVREVDAWWSNKNLAIGDANGDGSQELVVNGPSGGDDGVWLLDLETGAARGFIGTPGWKLLGGPMLMDLGDNGSMQLVARATPATAGEGEATDGAGQKATKGAILIRYLDHPYDVTVEGLG